MKILESVGFLKELLFAFVEELNRIEQNSGRFLVVTSDSIEIKPEMFGCKKIESDLLNSTNQSFSLLTADDDRELMTVIVENFLASRFDIEVDQLDIKHLKHYRVVSYQGHFCVAVIVQPSTLVNEVSRLSQFCNNQIEF